MPEIIESLRRSYLGSFEILAKVKGEKRVHGTRKTVILNQLKITKQRSVLANYELEVLTLQLKRITYHVKRITFIGLSCKNM